MADQELFDLPAPGPSKHGGSRIGSGRPPAALNRMSRDISQYLRGKHGEAIEESFRFCMRPVLSNVDELLALADYLKCSRLEAAEFYARMCEKTFPYAYPRMAQIEVKPPGAPSPGLPFEIDGDVRDHRHSRRCAARGARTGGA